MGLWRNVWFGTTTENQEEFDRRWPILRDTPASVHFVSYEPMLGPLVLGDARPSWLICGCESRPGGKAGRPYELDWVRGIRDQCQAAGIAFFLKPLAADGRIVSLPESDGRQWCDFPATRLVRAAA